MDQAAPRRDLLGSLTPEYEGTSLFIKVGKYLLLTRCNTNKESKSSMFISVFVSYICELIFT